MYIRELEMNTHYNCNSFSHTYVRTYIHSYELALTSSLFLSLSPHRHPSYNVLVLLRYVTLDD
jgi:hypothetical protein